MYNAYSSTGKQTVFLRKKTKKENQKQLKDISPSNLKKE